MGDYRVPAARAVQLSKYTARFDVIVGGVRPRHAHRHQCISQGVADMARTIGSSPFQVRTGLSLQIKLVYMACLIEAYSNGGDDFIRALQATRHDFPLKGIGMDIMSEYKQQCRHRFKGDMAVAFDRTRGGRS